MTQGQQNNSVRINRQREEEEEEEAKRAELQSYIPDYLKQFITPYHDEFCYTRIYDERLVAALMVEGFLPIATEGIILPKLHHHRSVVSLPESLHVSKSIRKKSKKYRLTINQCFDRVVEGCRRQHGPRCWLYPELVRVFKEIHDAGQLNSVVVHSNTNRREAAPVRLYSIEVFNEETGDLAAGELGYTVGSIYTSLTGFSAENSAGSVQLAALGRLLSTLHFSMWDLGMGGAGMEYKQNLGSHLLKRDDFVAHVHNVRVTKGFRILPTANNTNSTGNNASSNYTGYNCKSLIDRELPLVSMSTIDGENKVSFIDATPSSNVNKSNRGENRQKTAVNVHNRASDDHSNSSQPNRKKQRNILKVR